MKLKNEKNELKEEKSKLSSRAFILKEENKT